MHSADTEGAAVASSKDFGLRAGVKICITSSYRIPHRIGNDEVPLLARQAKLSGK